MSSTVLGNLTGTRMVSVFFLFSTYKYEYLIVTCLFNLIILELLEYVVEVV